MRINRPQIVDMRLPSSKAAAQQRSINLAISSRGIAAIEAIHPSAAERFLNAVIPMRGRMIHHVGGRQESQPYDKDGQVRITLHECWNTRCSTPLLTFDRSALIQLVVLS